MSVNEEAVLFACGDARLLGIVNCPQEAFTRGVLVVVGGPQYRAGSHRQFTLLCRDLAQRGIAAMRFDYRGMGDSDGERHDFEQVQLDICAAIDAFHRQVPQLREIVIWGLCDAASAALFYAYQDPRVTGLVLLNPWVRTTTGIAKARLKHYYWSRLGEREFWNKVVRGEFAAVASAKSFARELMTSLGAKKPWSSKGTTEAAAPPKANATRSLPDRMAEGLEYFKGKVLLILSGNDLTAKEFSDVAQASKRWNKLLAKPRVERYALPDADHTFASKKWRDEVAARTADWVRSW